ncbi:MAG TPA: phosphatase PAP2 family protein, partial [Chloroflexota bacterium]|nr:phosphatase PAP2 family protein [Chloroflexota bacterium]
QSKRLTIEIDGRHRRTWGWDVLIANAGTLGTPLLHWSPEICPTDGHLNLLVLEIVSLLDVFKVVWRLLLNLPRNEPPLVLYDVDRACRVATARPAPVQGDGEIIGNTPVVVEVVPRAVTVLVSEECPARTCSISLREARGRERAWHRQALLRPWLGPLGLLDTSAALLVSAMPHPPILNLAMHTLAGVMNRGDGWLFGLLLATLQRAASPRDFLRVAIPLSLVNLVVEFGLKRVFQRNRPFDSRVLAPVIGKKPSSHSFPSGHTAASFAAAWLLSRIFPNQRAWFYALASLVAFSRIYLGVHYFTDILAGAASGTALAEILGRLVGMRD